MAKTNSNKNSNRHFASRKFFIGAAIAVLLVLAVSSFGTQLTGWQVVSSAINLSVESVTLDSIQIHGNTTKCSYSALRFTSSRSDAFRFATDNTPQIWFLVKNRTMSGCNSFNGRWLYVNASEKYTIPPSFLTPTTRYINQIISSVTYYYGSGARFVPIKVNANGRFRNTGGQTPNGNTTRLNITIQDGRGVSYTGRWITPGVYGPGGAGSPTIYDLEFNSYGPYSRQTWYRYTNGTLVSAYVPPLPGTGPLFCSPRGSCLVELRHDLVLINYAT